MISHDERIAYIRHLIAEGRKTRMSGEDPCWDGYQMVGTKKGAGGKEVPNCVPEEVEHVNENDLASSFLKTMHSAGFKNAKLVDRDQKKKDTEELMRQRAAAAAKRPAQPHYAPPEKYPLGGRDEKSGRSYSEEVELDERELTDAELKKREQIARAIERKNPRMDMSKKMAIATATAKRVA